MTTSNKLQVSYSQNFQDMIFGQRVAYIIDLKGLSKTWVAKKLGISKQAFNYLIKHSIKPKFVDELANLLELNPSWLETGEGAHSTSIKSGSQSAQGNKLPIFNKSMLLSGKKQSEIDVDFIDFSVENPEDFIAYKLVDNSNFPPFIQDSILIFHTKEQPSNEDYILTIIDGDLYVRQYLKESDNICYKANNDEHKTFINSEAEILGVLVEARYLIN